MMQVIGPDGHSSYVDPAVVFLVQSALDPEMPNVRCILHLSNGMALPCIRAAAAMAVKIEEACK